MIITGFHGTFHNFSQFSVSNSHRWSDLGAGVYVTSCIDDANRNYSKKSSPDHAQKRSELAEQLNESGEFESWKEAEAEAEEILGMNNRAQILKVGSVLMDHQIVEFNELKQIKRGDVEEILDILSEMMDINEHWDDLEYLTSEKIFQFKEIHDFVFNNVDYFENCGETLREICLAIGIKCVKLEKADQRYRMDMNWNTTHYCIFDESAIKILNRQFADEV